MTHTPDEIKKGLECCRNLWDCKNKDCPYLGDGCYPKLHEDIKALIQKLQAENDDLIGENGQLLIEVTLLQAKTKQLEADKQQLEGLLTHMNQLRDAAAGRALKMEERVHQLEAERDAAVEDLESYATLKCFACKYYTTELTEAPCNECKIMGKGNHDKFEWRGVQKEESDA